MGACFLKYSGFVRTEQSNNFAGGTWPPRPALGHVPHAPSQRTTRRKGSPVGHWQHFSALRAGPCPTTASPFAGVDLRWWLAFAGADGARMACMRAFGGGFLCRRWDVLARFSLGLAGRCCAFASTGNPDAAGTWGAHERAACSDKAFRWRGPQREQVCASHSPGGPGGRGRIGVASGGR